jgi:hypothetical protein
MRGKEANKSSKWHKQNGGLRAMRARVDEKNSQKEVVKRKLDGHE